MTGTSETAVILLTSTTAWCASGFMFQQVCDPTGRCAGVLGHMGCGRWNCPGGHVLRLDGPVGAVEPWPASADELIQEIEAMQQDKVLQPLAGLLLHHLNATQFQRNTQRRYALPIGKDRVAFPPRWIGPNYGPWHWEVGLAIAPGIWLDETEQSEEKRFLYGGTIRAGFRYQGRLHKSGSGSVDGCIMGLVMAVWEIVSGNQWGLDAQFHIWREGDRTRFGLGLKPALSLVLSDKEEDGIERVRLPASFGLMLPEVGLHLDNHETDPGLYLRWQAPVSVMLTSDVGLDIRFSGGFLAFGEREGFAMSLELGLLFR